MTPRDPTPPPGAPHDWLPAEPLARERAARRLLGLLVVPLLVGWSGYTAVVASMPALRPLLDGHSSWVSFPVLAGFGFGAALFVRGSGAPADAFGWTLRGGVRAAWTALLWLVPWVLLLVLLRIVAFDTIGGREVVLPHYTRREAELYLLGYVVFVVVQEWVARGVFQTALEVLLPGRHARELALLLANLMFAASHLHVSLQLALATAVPGLFWGWLYLRQRTLVGVVLHHVGLGVAAWWLLGPAALR